MPNVYKSFNWSSVKNRNVTDAPSAKKTQVNTILSNFVTYFKAKHT